MSILSDKIPKMWNKIDALNGCGCSSLVEFQTKNVVDQFGSGLVKIHRHRSHEIHYLFVDIVSTTSKQIESNQSQNTEIQKTNNYKMI